MELFPEDESLHRWLTLAGERVAFQGFLVESAGSGSANVIEPVSSSTNSSGMER